MRVTEPEDMQQYVALYRATVAQAVGGAGALMARLVAHVRASLRESESEAGDRRERDRLTQSRRLLNQFEGTLCARFTEELQNAFNRVSSTERAVPAAPTDLQFDQLAGMDEAQVRQSVATARVQHVVQTAAETTLSELNRLVCAMLGLKEVRLERNPLRPAVYVDAVTAALVHLPVPSATRQGWISMMTGALGRELDIYYHDLCAELRDRGVTGAHGAASADGRWTASAAGVPGRTDAGLLTLEKLRQLLVEVPHDAQHTLWQRYEPATSDGNGESGFASTGQVSIDFSATVPAAFEALREMKQVEQVAQRLQRRKTPGAQDASERQRARDILRQSAHGLEQTLGLEVVEMMVDNITHDPRLLGPIQRLVADLEPALLQLALVDPRFFSHKQHPARRLLYEITHRSIAFESVDSRGFSGFMEPLQEAVAPLAATAIDTAEPFDRALSRLVEFWDAPGGADKRQLDRAVKALKEAEQRNALAATIVADLQSRPDGALVPAPVIDFLSGPWAQVVAHARISDRTGAMDPGAYAQAIDDVLWSAQPALTARKRAALGLLVPQLLVRLREGLATIDYPVAGTSAFFALLESLHRQGLDPHASFSATASGLAQPPFPDSALRPVVADSVWLAPTEALASGFIDLDTASRPAAVREPREARADVLALGVWVALQAEDGWTRTRLVWFSPNGTLLLFSDALGYMQSLTRRACDQMFAQGQLRIISTDPVEDALDAVAQAAMRNSVDVRV